MSDATTTGSRALICPFCELQELQPFGRSSARCEYCGDVLSAALLQTLRQITALPDVIGRHACECGHPEMRRLPDGVFHCPGCGSEVLPISAPPIAWKSGDRSEAYWSGWLDGRFGDLGCFTNNRRLAGLKAAPDRLDYYRGHRAGRESAGLSVGLRMSPKI